MKNKIRITALMTALLLTVPLITGCQNNTGSTANPFWSDATAVSDIVTSVPQESVPTESVPISSPTESSLVSTEPRPTNNDISPAAWKVEDRDGHIIYMMGSIHMGDDSVQYMPDYIENAYLSCDSLAVEADISGILEDPAQAQQYAGMFLYSDGTKIQDHISEETYNGCVELLTSANLYNSMYDLFKPFIWTSAMSQTFPNDTGLDYNKGVDMMFLTRAKNENKTILEVESLTFQFEMFNSFSDELNDLMMSEYLQPNFGTLMNEGTLELFNAWKYGTVSEELILTGTFTEQDADKAALYQEYIDKLVLTRNRSMAETAEQYLQNGQKVFFLVGVLHFYGEGGILDLLQQAGYTITPLS